MVFCTWVQVEHYLVKMWEALLRNIRFIQESDVFDVYDSLMIIFRVSLNTVSLELLLLLFYI